MKPYLYYQGLKKIVRESRGDETVHVGIRPYGFHAGNTMALIVYPYLFCKYLEDAGKEPRLKFVVSLNNWEQDALDGPDYRKYPFNIYPKTTSLQFASDEVGCCKSVAAHWEPIIKKRVLFLKKRFPNISIKFVENSELINYPFCKKLLVETIKHPDKQADIYRKYSHMQVLPSPIKYAGAICFKCRSAHGETAVIGRSKVIWKCDDCGSSKEGDFKEFDYWWYHKPMLIARIKIFKVDITLSGGDHFNEGDFKIREIFIRKYASGMREPKMMFTPTVIALDGIKMSKSRNNAAFADAGRFIEIMNGYKRKEFAIVRDLMQSELDEKDYSNIL